MCLNSIHAKFQMEWDPLEDAFIGYGYKSYTEIIDSAGRVNPSLIKGRTGVGLNKKNWSEANGTYNGKSKTKNESTEGGTAYWPGFHIFLNEKDARGYHVSGTVLKVKFKELICIGTNETFCSNKLGHCVIARYMKIVEVL